MIDINYEVKRYRGRKVVSRNTRGNDSNPHRDVHHYRMAVAFSSKASLDMVVRGLEDLEALFEMRLNEAKSAGETFAADAAATELQVVMEALAALYSASTLSPR